VTGILLAKGALDSFPVTTILAESSEEYLDPRAASNVLKVLARITGVPFNTAKLEKEAEEFSKDIKESVLKSRIMKKKGPSANEGGSMYG
jgi:predicted ATP-grasp superfamily ATP-dependent carboligase